jgi:ribosomal protein L7/L12
MTEKVKQIRANLSAQESQTINDLLDNQHQIQAIKYVYNNVLNRNGLKEAKEVIDLIRSERSALKRT